MTKQEFHTYQEQTFDSFCKRVIRNAAVDAKREISRRAKHEIVFSAMTATELAGLVFEDRYTPDPAVFYVRGCTLVVLDEQLGQALTELIPTLREVVLLHHFHDKSMKQIAGILGISQNAVRYRYKEAMGRLRRILEAMDI